MSEDNSNEINQHILPDEPNTQETEIEKVNKLNEEFNKKCINLIFKKIFDKIIIILKSK